MWKRLVNGLRHLGTDERGFTLMELMIVVVIVAILAAGGVVGYGFLIQRAVNSDAANFKTTMETAVRLYESDIGTPAGNLASNALASALDDYVDGLPTFNVVTTAPTASSAAGYYVKCPANGQSTWQVWAVRNGRVNSADQTFTASAVTVNNGCGAAQQQ